MQFIFDGEACKAVKITGPTHNMLGLVFDKNKSDSINLVDLNSKNNAENNIDPMEVKKQVLSGIEKANLEFSVEYYVKQIEFVSSDTFSLNVYEELTIEIIKRLVKKG